MRASIIKVISALFPNWSIEKISNSRDKNIGEGYIPKEHNIFSGRLIWASMPPSVF
jgi:hypothetical protein